MTNKKSKIPYILLVFFLVVVSVNVAFIVISKNSLPGVAIENSYNKGIKYNDTIKQKEDQQELGWDVEFVIRQAGENEKDIVLKLLDRDKKLVKNADVMVKFFRPTYDGIDFEVKFDEESGIYRKQVEFPALGQWDFEVVAVRGDDRFFAKKRFVIHNFGE